MSCNLVLRDIASCTGAMEVKQIGPGQLTSIFSSNNTNLSMTSLCFFMQLVNGLTICPHTLKTIYIFHPNIPKYIYIKL